MKAPRFRWGIRDLLILLIVVTLAPFFALEVFRAAQDIQRQGDEVAHRTQVQAAEAAQVTDDFLGFTERSLASYAAAPLVRSLDSDKSRSFLEGVRSQHPNYEGVFLFAPDGTEVTSTQPGLYGRLNQERAFVQQALLAGKMATSDTFALPGTDRRVVLLTYPVAGQQGAPVGVLGIALNLNRLSSVINYAHLSPGSVVALLQPDSTVIAASSNVNAWVGRPLNDGGAHLPPLAGRNSGISVESLRDNIPRVMAYQAVQAAPWLIVAGIPQAEIDVARRDALTRIAEEVALAVASAVLLAWVMLRRMLVPIRALSDGARDFSAGRLDRRIALRRDDELGSLADVLNDMAGRLKQRLDEESAHAEALRSLNRLQTEFVATASHELRTPVTAIRTYVEALLRPEISDEALRRECLEGIDRTSARLANLARRLLDVSKIDSGQIALDIAPIDAADVAQAVVEQTVCRDGDSLELRIESGNRIVEADAERLEEVLDNLISNAIKFSSPVATVSVTVGTVDGGVTIVVRDAGPGIPSSELSRIFDRFYQVPGVAARRIGGSGLGLYIARAYVLAMGGRLWVESTLGQGSAFSVFLPSPARTNIPPLESDDVVTTTPAVSR